MLLAKRSMWITIAAFFSGILLGNSSTANAQLAFVQAEAMLNEVFADTSQESEDDLENPYSDIADEFGNSMYSEETDGFGNRIGVYSNTSRFPLYAMIKSENIYLYGIENNTHDYGMILYKDNRGTYFEWPDLAQRRNWMPELSYIDYDGDGEKEIAAIICSNVGTGLYLTDLHILKPKLDEWEHLNYIEYSLMGEDIAQWFVEEFTIKFSQDNNELIINFAGHDYHLDTKDERYRAYDENGWDDLQGVGYGNSNEFYFTQNREIKVVVGIEFEFKNWGKNGSYFGSVGAKVNFDGGKFTLSDYRLIIDET